MSFLSTFFSAYRHDKYGTDPKKQTTKKPSTKTQVHAHAHTHTHLRLTSCNHCHFSHSLLSHHVSEGGPCCLYPFPRFHSVLNTCSCHLPLLHWNTLSLTSSMISLFPSPVTTFSSLCAVFDTFLLLLESLHSLGFYAPWFSSCLTDNPITDPIGELYVFSFQKLP